MKNGGLIAWFLRFLNVDLEKLAYADVLKLVVELEGALRGYSYGEDRHGPLMVHQGTIFAEEDPHIGTLLHGGGEKLGRLQTALQDFVVSIKTIYDKAKNCANTRLNKNELDSLRSLGRIEFTFEAEARLWAPFSMLGDVDSITGYSYSEEDLDEATCKVRTSSEDIENLIKYQFLMSFNGRPLKALRKCPICSKWFLHLSKREREFCSNRCAAKNISRERYAALKQNPARYRQELKKKQKKNRDYYDKKTEKASGGKVTRRQSEPKED
jgi:hypothetical protein